MNKGSGSTVRQSYGRVLMSEARKCLEEMENEEEVDVVTSPENSDPLSGVPIIDMANKENRADYASQLLASCGYDNSARNSIYGPARSMTASNQAYRPMLVLLPSKSIARPEDILHNGPSSTAVSTKTTAMHMYDPPKPHHSSQSVEDALRNLSLNPRSVDKTRLDVAARTSHSTLADPEPKLMQTPFSQKPVSYSRVPVSYQKPDFYDDDEDLNKKNSVQDESHSTEDFKNSFLGFVEPSSAVSLRTRGDDGTATKNTSTSINFSELMASLDFNKQKIKTHKLDSVRADRNDQKFDHHVELVNTSDSFHKSIRFTDIDYNPQRSLHRSESSSTRENQSLPFRLDKLASASDLYPKRSRPPESLYDVHERHFFESSKTAEAHRKPAEMSELSNTGEIHRRSVRNPDSVNFIAPQEERSVRKNEVLSNTGGLCQKSLASQELSNTMERGQRSALVRDSQTVVGSASQRLTNGTCSVTNPPRTASSILTDMKTLVINGNTYILIRVIGKGGSSKVYQGIAPNCKICAVKCVSFANAEESMISSYRNEIRLLQQLQNSEEVVKLYDYMFDEDANMLYVVMECGQMDLQTFFRIKESEMWILRMFVRPYWIQMLRAVQVLHKQGIVHSDLKPANFILVCGQLKLIDFGIAKTVLPDCTSVMCDEIVGTFNYMSPEAVTDLNGGRDLCGESKPNIKIGTRSDVWSLGCILYYLVFSHTPFEHIRNPIMKLQAIMNPSYKIEYPATKIPHVVDVMKRCLERNSKNRPTIEELLQHPYVTSD